MFTESHGEAVVPEQRTNPEVRPCASGEARLTRAPGGGAKGERVRRLLRIMVQLLIHPKTLTISELACLLGVCRRTVFRDIQLLREIGLPILFDPKQGCYCLFNVNDIPDVSGPVASIQIALESAAYRLGGADDGASEVPDWPFNWQESVALLALLRAAPAPEGTEWRAILQCIDLELKRRVRRAFGRKAGTISAHAALLAFKPYLSVNALRSSMEQFWRCRMEPD